MDKTKIGCPRCAEGKKYISYRWNDAEAKKRGYVDSLYEVKKLKVGSLHRCPKCNISWYLKTWGKGIQDMCFVEDVNLPLLEKWNNKKLTIPNSLLEKLKYIKATPLPWVSGLIHVPCAIKLKTGGTLDFCLISIQKTPPLGSQNILIDEVEDIFESEYTLSQKIRLATSLAEEETMMNAPTYAKDRENRFFNLQFEPEFFEKDGIKGKDLVLLEPKDFDFLKEKASKEWVYSRPKKIIYIIADWFDGCESLFIQMPKYMQVLSKLHTRSSCLPDFAQKMGMTMHEVYFLRRGYANPDEGLEQKILQYGRQMPLRSEK
jgi:hypothetical protein